jgi:hypothetical protein
MHMRGSQRSKMDAKNEILRKAANPNLLDLSYFIAIRDILGRSPTAHGRRNVSPMITIDIMTPKTSKFRPAAGPASSLVLAARTSPSKRRTTQADSRTLEANVVGMAMNGKLAKAGRRAVASQVGRGLPVTFKRGQKVIKLHADGREEVLGMIDRPSYTLPKGVRVIR